MHELQPFTEPGMNQEDQGKIAIASHLQLMHSQRTEMFHALDGLSLELLWKKPSPQEWTIGENLDHLRVIYESWLSILRGFWFLFKPWARLRRQRPYITEIDNVYRRPGFPQKVGWIWPPRYTPQNPAALETLRKNVEEVHAATEKFYLTHEPVLLGHVPLYDPAIGKINLIQALRVAVYHDEMHLEQVLRTLTEVKG
jgi:hypothetical protein